MICGAKEVGGKHTFIKNFIAAALEILLFSKSPDDRESSESLSEVCTPFGVCFAIETNKFTLCWRYLVLNTPETVIVKQDREDHVGRKV